MVGMAAAWVMGLVLACAGGFVGGPLSGGAGAAKANGSAQRANAGDGGGNPRLWCCASGRIASPCDRLCGGTEQPQFACASTGFDLVSPMGWLWRVL